MSKLAISVFVMLVSISMLGCEQKFAIKNVSPAVGVLGGGESVEILGSGFDPNMGISVYFGNVKADNVVVSAKDKLLVTTPSSGTPNVVDVRIATDSGKEYLIKRAFRYVETNTMDIRDLGKRKSQRQQPQE